MYDNYIAYARMLYVPQMYRIEVYPETVDNTHAHARTHAHTLAISAYFVVCSRMPRVYIRKTDKGQVPREVMERAIQAVKEGMPVRKAAKTYSIARTTLNNNLVKAKKDSTAKLEPNYKHSHIFNQEQETSLANYLENMFRYVSWANYN